MLIGNDADGDGFETAIYACAEERREFLRQMQARHVGRARAQRLGVRLRGSAHRRPPPKANATTDE
jgi:hypothetical protein